MFGRSVIKTVGQMRSARSFGKSVALRDAKTSSTPIDVYSQKLKTANIETVLGPQMYRPTDFDKWLLVWTKHFSSKNQVPDRVGQNLYQRAQSQGRIKVVNIMIVCATIGCIAAVFEAKREAKAGHSLIQDTHDWHTKINDEYKQQQAAATYAEIKTF